MLLRTSFLMEKSIQIRQKYTYEHLVKEKQASNKKVFLCICDCEEQDEGEEISEKRQKEMTRANWTIASNNFLVHARERETSSKAYPLLKTEDLLINTREYEQLF